MSVEVQLEENGLETLEDLEEKLEAENGGNFRSVRPPEEINEDMEEALFWENVHEYLVLAGGATGVSGILSFFAAASSMNPVSAVSVAAAFYGVGQGCYSLNEVKKQRDNIEDYGSERDKWNELPGVVDLSSVLEGAISCDEDVSYAEFREEALKWSDQAFACDLSNKELKQKDVGAEVEAPDPSEYGYQRVFLDDSPTGEDQYRFVLETYTPDEDLVARYWGITGEKGRRIVEENDGVSDF